MIMRQIKFRAKTTAIGSWIYGSLIDYGNNAFAIRNKSIYWVHPKTLGQFTGLTDCNGKEIYEGDIVKACSQGEHRICEVAWGEKTASFFLKHPAGAWYLSGAWGNESCEVIGNVFDTPSLIPNQPTAI